MTHKAPSLFDGKIVGPAMGGAFKKLDPRLMMKNPVMFVTMVGAALTTVGIFAAPTGRGLIAQLAIWLWFTVLFANFAEAVAEGRGKAQAASLRKARKETPARRLRNGREEKIPAPDLQKGDLVVCEAGDVIPADGDVIEGIASVDEAAITGESAPVIRESGGDRSAVTGGTRVLSDRIVIRVTMEKGHGFLDRMIALVEGAQRQKTPNEIALTILLAALTFIFLLVCVTLKPFGIYSSAAFSVPVLIALLVCLIPTTIGGLLSAFGIAGMDRVLQRNVLAMSGREVAQPHAKFVPFTAQTRMSGVDIPALEGQPARAIRKGAAEAMRVYVDQLGGSFPQAINQAVDDISGQGGTPLVVAEGHDVLDVVHLKDMVKGGIKERFDHLRKMGIRTVMITGDNPLTAAAIAAEAGVDDFMAQATPEAKLKRIRQEQAAGHLVAMTGDGTNDAPALAQADVGVAMNTGTQAAREAGNMVDLDSNPTKLLDIVEIGKQMLITRGSLTTFSIANDVAKYFAIMPAMLMATFPAIAPLNIMRLHSPASAILSAVVFNALLIIALIPLALRGVKYTPIGALATLQRNLVIYGVGGVIIPFIGIKLIDLIITSRRLVSAAGTNGYDAANSGGSNLGPTSQKLHDAIKDRIAAYRQENALAEGAAVPADAVSDDIRPNPDALLAALQKEDAKAKRGKLKVFFGMTPGVGKTYAMLEAARRELAAGRDVAIGYVETHGRKETDAVTEGLPVIPRRSSEYRGVALTEMDLDAVLARRPQLALVDEFAHTNAPGSRHTKRHQDVVELLEAGIDVFTTLNVQQVESRAEAVRQITGVAIRETLPDTALDGAEIELVDLPPEELRSRLAAGKVYLPENARAAREHFFRPGNLAALRELALRFTAEHVGHDVLAYR